MVGIDVGSARGVSAQTRSFRDPFGSLSRRLSLRRIIEEGLVVHARGLSEAERTERVCAAPDMSVQARIVDLLRDSQRRLELAYLFISHDMNVVRAMAARLIVMRGGRVVEAGLAEDVFANPREAYTQELPAAAFLRHETQR